MNEKGSLNLELALLIMLLALVVIFGLNWIGNGIANRYTEASELLLSGDFETGITSVGNSVALLSVSGGTSPYTITLTNNGVDTILGTDFPAGDIPVSILPGDNTYLIEDSDGNSETQLLEDQVIHAWYRLPTAILLAGTDGVTDINITNNRNDGTGTAWVYIRQVAVRPTDNHVFAVDRGNSTTGAGGTSG